MSPIQPGSRIFRLSHLLLWLLPLACNEKDIDLFCRTSCEAGDFVAVGEPVVVCGDITICPFGAEPEHGECDEPRSQVSLLPSGVPCPFEEPTFDSCVSCTPQTPGVLELTARLRDDGGRVVTEEQFGPVQVVVPTYRARCFKFMDDFRRLCSVPGIPDRVEVVVSATFQDQPIEVSPVVTSSWDGLEFDWSGGLLVDEDATPPKEPVELTVTHGTWTETLSIQF